MSTSHLEVALDIANTIVAPTMWRMPSGTCSRRVAVRPGSCRIASVTRVPGAGQGQRASAPSLTWLRPMMTWRLGMSGRQICRSCGRAGVGAGIFKSAALVAAEQLAPAVHRDQDQAQPRDDGPNAEGDTSENFGASACCTDRQTDAERAGAGPESHEAPDHGEGGKNREHEQILKQAEPIGRARRQFAIAPDFAGDGRRD